MWTGKKNMWVRVSLKREGVEEQDEKLSGGDFLRVV